MPAQWTADLIGEMHLKKISKKQLAAHLEITPEYVSMVLNGHRSLADAEKRFRAALEMLLCEREGTT